MKNISLSIFAAAMLLVGFNANAQAQIESSAPGAEIVTGTDSTAGGILLLPDQSRAGAEAVLEKEEPVIKNVAHARSKKIGKMVNGYYKMAGERDWGTNARLNAYGYVQYTVPTYNPEADMPVYPAGIEEGETTTDETAVDGTETDEGNNTEANAWDW